MPQEDGGDHDARAPAVLFVKSVHEAPYNISVLQVGAVRRETGEIPLDLSAWTR